MGNLAHPKQTGAPPEFTPHPTKKENAILPPFLTDLDPRGAIKGSRDPLGIQPIWTRFARHIIGNLTNASNNARDFTVLMLGCHFSSKIARETGPEVELPVFLRWEQLAAYARAEINSDRTFRGVERATKNLASAEVTISEQPIHQILSNQKAYGIWGLYSVPGRASGLIGGYPARLTPAAQALVDEAYLPALNRTRGTTEADLVSILANDATNLRLREKHSRRVLEGVAAVLRLDYTNRERDFYRHHLLEGGPDRAAGDEQVQLTELLQEETRKGEIRWSPTRVRQIAQIAEKRGWPVLANRLRRIATAERLLAPASSMFNYLLGCDDIPVEKVAQQIAHKDALGAGLVSISTDETAQLRDEIGGGDDAEATRWISLANALRAGDFKEAIRLFADQNQAVMHARGGAAWVEIEKGRLRVRVQDERGALPSTEDLKEMWRFPYFLDSHRNIAAALTKGRS